MTLLNRPCGACDALVDVEIGCKHWKPERARATVAKARAAREQINAGRKNDRADQRQMVDEFKAMMGPGRKT